MPTAKRSLKSSKNYRTFVASRDTALDIIHNNNQNKITDILGGALERVRQIIVHDYQRAQGGNLSIRALHDQISQVMTMAQSQLLQTAIDLRRAAYTLAFASEAEAIARATGKPTRAHLSASQISHKASGDTFAGGSMSDRIKLYLDRLTRKIVDNVQLSAVQDSSMEEMLDRLRRAWPKVRVWKSPPRKLKKITEAKTKLSQWEEEGQSLGYDGPTLSTGFVDDAEWERIVDQYSKEYELTNRGPDGELDVQLGEGSPRYEWELEKEMTQDFVQQVRTGQIDAATENGYTDFQWIAIVDDKTDECCVWRDGLTTAQIQLALQNEQSEDDCDAITPPAHFNCRCSLAPVSEDLPEIEPIAPGEFEDWLDQTNS